MNASQHNLLLSKSKELFMRYGIKNLTMDEVAKEMGMSKKTVYIYADNKADLVKQVMLRHIEEEQELLKEIYSRNINAIEELIAMVNYFSAHLREFNPALLFDLQKYYPDSWAVFNDFRYNFIYQCIRKNLTDGMKQKLYRNKLNVDVVAKLYVGSIDVLFNQDLFPSRSYHFIDIYKQFLEQFLHGVATEEGRKIIAKAKTFND
jgi:AcrR family transcriptional regulator